MVQIFAWLKLGESYALLAFRLKKFIFFKKIFLIHVYPGKVLGATYLSLAYLYLTSLINGKEIQSILTIRRLTLR